jgi:hypothetical protein
MEVNSILKHFPLFQKLIPPPRASDRPPLFPGKRNRARTEESRVRRHLMHFFYSQHAWELNSEEKQLLAMRIPEFRETIDPKNVKS